MQIRHFTISQNSKSIKDYGDNYIVYNNGYKRCWGRSNTYGSQTTFVEFPIEFENNPTVVLTPESNSTDFMVWAKVYARTTTGFSYTVQSSVWTSYAPGFSQDPVLWSAEGF